MTTSEHHKLLHHVRCSRCSVLDAQTRMSVNLQLAFETRVCPVSTLGKGRTGHDKKTINTANIFLMECNTWEEFDEKRGEVAGATTDQAAERMIADNTVRTVPGYPKQYASSDPQCFLCPTGLVLCVVEMFSFALSLIREHSRRILSMTQH